MITAGASVAQTGPAVVAGLGVCVSSALSADAFFARLRSTPPAPDEVELAQGHSIRMFRLPQDLDFAARVQRLALAPEVTDRLLRLARRATPALQATLLAAAEAWAGGTSEGPVCSERTALYVAGNNLNQQAVFDAFRDFLDSDFVSPGYAVACFDTQILGAVSEAFAIHGDGALIGATSASGTVALARGLAAIRSGLCDHCLVVAPPTVLSVAEMMGLYNANAMAGFDATDAPSGLCRPFDRAHSGFVLGEGAAAILLAAPHGARADGGGPVLRLAGAAVRLDGHAKASPSAQGEARAMRAAIEDAGLTPADIRYVSAHGTGSVKGDAVEFEALIRTFGAAASVPPVNATKAFTGHCLSSAGLIEAVATCLQLRAGTLHGNPNLSDPIDPDIAVVGPKPMEWDGTAALSASYAFGGINAAIVLQTEQGDTS